MAETISGKCEFDAESVKIFLQTNINGDTITIAGVHLDSDSAASLAWLLNEEESLHVEIKKAGE